MHVLLFFVAAAAIAGAVIGIAWAAAWYWRALVGMYLLCRDRDLPPDAVYCDRNVRDDTGALDITRRGR